MSVLMVGPDMNAKGGISSVISMYGQAGLFERCRFLPSTSDGSALRRVAWFAVFLLRYTAALLLNPSIRIVHIHVAVKGSLLRKSLVVLLAQAFRRKVIIHFHGAQFIVLYENSSPRTQRLIRWLFRSADQVICLNNTCREHIRETTGAEARVVFNPAILHAPVEQSGYKVNFLFMGRLGQRKGVYDIIEAARRIQADNAVIHLYGDGELGEVEAKIAEAGVQDKVILHGWISGEEKDRVFRGSQVLLLPSYNEGMPISVLEALSYGMPVITTPVGGIPDAVKEGINGYLIRPGNVQALAEKVDLMAASPTLRHALGEAGFEKAARDFDIHRIVQELESIYRQMGPQSGAPQPV